MFGYRIVSMIHIEIFGKTNIFLVKDMNYIYLLDLKNLSIYPIIKSDFEDPPYNEHVLDTYTD
jgi:hypothetical protein